MALPLLLFSNRNIAPKNAFVSPWYLAGGVSSSNCVVAYQPKNAESLEASFANLANQGASYNASLGVAPGWNASDGWIFGGTEHLTTGLVPSHQWSAIVRIKDAGTSGNRYIFGSGSSAYFALTNAYGGDNSVGYLNGGVNIASVSPNATNGVLGFAGKNAYRDGNYDGLISGGWSGSYFPIFIGAANLGSVFGNFVGKIQAFAVYNTIVSSDQMAAISGAMAML